MILPSNETCVEVIEALADEPNLTAWEMDFVESNEGRTWFSDAQRAVIARLMEKYDV